MSGPNQVCRLQRCEQAFRHQLSLYLPSNKPQICMKWLKKNIPLGAELNEIALRLFFFYFISSCLFNNNWSVLTYQLLSAIRVVSDIEAYDWGSLYYRFFIAYLRQASQQGFRSLEGCWLILMWRTYEHIPTLHPQYYGLSSTKYPRVYAWSLYTITKVILT